MTSIRREVAYLFFSFAFVCESHAHDVFALARWEKKRREELEYSSLLYSWQTSDIMETIKCVIVGDGTVGMIKKSFYEIKDT